MKWVRTLCFSWTTSSFLLPARRFRLCSDARPPQLATNPRFPRKWEFFRNASLPPKRDQSLFPGGLTAPADDLTDPAPANTFAHLDSTIVLERPIAELGIYPAVDPLASVSNALSPEIVGEEHFRVARRVQEVLQSYKDLQDIIAILGLDELSPEQKQVVFRARKISCSFPTLPCRGSVYRSVGRIRDGQGYHPRIQDDP